MERLQRPDCHRCRSYYVTWDAAHPYGCRAFGIKSRALPSIAVERESGAPCHGFEPKSEPPPSATNGPRRQP